ncbi:GTP pyrophosphokinase [Vibrio ishigakensis]|uniref:GTP pyrophosphokinase n=1 Tax=Vibrio ishigakensis TaxID=1481914 RepID=A0A0B8QTW8_9VIBR|nr:GTP pyrophosphokinase [Vibrio ishigakensis]
MKRFNVNTADELYAGVGSGDIRINQVVNHINALVNKPTAEEEDQQALEKLQSSESDQPMQPSQTKMR